jgi:hypothetical protein
VRCETNRKPLYCNFMYHSRTVFSVGGSVWYVVRNLRCTIKTDSVLANSKTQNVFLFPVHALFHHDCPPAVKPPSTPWCLWHKKNLRDSLPTDMLPFSVTIPAPIPQRSEIPEGLMNYPVYCTVTCSISNRSFRHVMDLVELNKLNWTVQTTTVDAYMRTGQKDGNDAKQWM